MPISTADPLVGRVLDRRYRIVERIARGGMSTVYSAVDERLDRAVAVKVMASELSVNPAFSDRFVREARAAAQLASPLAVAVFDQGAEAAPDGYHVYLVMELVTGRTLRDLLRERRRLNPAQALSIMEPVLGALAAAHRAGLVHRDVKPENILLADDGAVKVADFGLARAVEADASSTRTGLMMGTVAYCAPEQIQRGQTDERCDVYAAGVVLFELLTGSPPYAGESAMAVAYQHVHSRVPAPSSRVGGIPTELDELVIDATDRDRSGRPADASEFLDRVSSLRALLRLPVVPVPPRARPARAARQPAGAAAPGFRRVAARTDAGGPTVASGRLPAVGSGRLPVTADGAAAIRRADDDATDVLHDSRRLQGYSDTSVDLAAAPGAGGRPPGGRSPGGPSPTAPLGASRRRHRRLRTALIVVLILILGAVLGAAAWWFTSGRYSRVPALGDRSPAAAASALRHDGFHIAAQRPTEFSNVPNGEVARTVPAAHQRVHRGATITLVISLGSKKYPVPNVAGRSPAVAIAALHAALPNTITQRQQANDTVPSGQVIGTQPPQGSTVVATSTITVLVSTGPPVITIPNIAPGTEFAQASGELTSAGFKVNRVDQFSTDYPAGQVISVSPTGTAVKFSTITVTVSKGPQTVTVPDVTGGTFADARKTLQGLGLVVVRDNSFGGRLNLVVATDPAAGVSVPVGSTVTVTVV